MIVASWNVNSIKIRLKSLINFIKKYDLDFICIQETKIKDEFFPVDELKNIGYNSYFSGEGGKNGVAIVSKNVGSFEKIGFLDGEEDFERRLISVKFDDFYLISVYVPLGGSKGSDRYYYKLKFFDRLKRYFNRFHKKNEKIILCGDFNVALQEVDVYDKNELMEEVGFLPEEREKLNDFLSFGFYDSFRIKNPNKIEFSWWDYRWEGFKKNKGMRIDYIFVTEPLISSIKEVFINIEPRKEEKPSDHAPVVAFFK